MRVQQIEARLQEPKEAKSLWGQGSGSPGGRGCEQDFRRPSPATLEGAGQHPHPQLFAVTAWMDCSLLMVLGEMRRGVGGGRRGSHFGCRPLPGGFIEGPGAGWAQCPGGQAGSGFCVRMIFTGVLLC